MDTNPITMLSARQVLPDFPFTHPVYVEQDRKVLEYIVERVCKLLENLPSLLSPSAVHLVAEEDGRYHRYIIPQPGRLAGARNLYLTGFFGQRRKQSPADYFGDIGANLAAAVAAHPDILVYNTLALPGDNYGNLILMADPSVKDAWMEGRTHARAIQISPGYYATVRIYNGWLAGDITQPQRIRITRVKYFDYLKDPVWRGIRTLQESQEL